MAAKRYIGAALVTGASSGLGAGFARRLAAQGYDLVLVARDAARLQALASRLCAQHGVRCTAISQDLSVPDAAQNVSDRCAELGYTIELLVNCAGAGSYGRFHESSAAGEARLVDLNCRAMVAMTSVFAPAMVSRGRGGIVFVASTAAFAPVPGFATYGASKAFVLSFGQAVAEDMKGTGVDVLTYCPGWIRSEFHRRAGMAQVPAHVVWTEPDDAAQTALDALGQRRLEVFRPPVQGRRVRLQRHAKRLLQHVEERLVPYSVFFLWAAQASPEFIAVL